MTGNSERPGALRFYFDVLACVARADQRIADEEREAILAAAKACELDATALALLEQRLDLERSFDLSAALDSAGDALSNPALVTDLLRDAYVLAAADLDVAPVELDVIRGLLSHAGYDRTSSAVLMEWARKAAEHHIDGLRLAIELRRR